MTSPKKIFTQINRLTSDMVGLGICDSQNFPSYKKSQGNVVEIGISDSDCSIFLKSISYSDMFSQLDKKRMYNLKMIDGAMLSMYYRFVNNNLVSHRLSFFPSPDLEAFQNGPDIYYDDELYIDIIDRRIVTIPIRFDYDKQEGVYAPVKHPISHLTLGQYEHCRIPVTTAMTPYQFIEFIMMNFYHTAFENFNDKLTFFKDDFEETIFDEEKKIIHIHTPHYRQN